MTTKQSQYKLRKGEYLGPDGTPHCKICHQSLVMSLSVLDQVYTVRRLCACGRQAREEEHRRLAHQEFLDRVSRNRSVGLSDPELKKCSFDRDDGSTPELARAKAYVDAWQTMEEKALGLILWGDVGTGKTFFAGCIANALLDRGVPVLMTNFSRILNRLASPMGEDRNAYIESLSQYKLLIIDDLGVERNSEYALEQVFSVIDSRYRQRLPMIITTNLTLAELRGPEDMARARIYDRILERCVPIQLQGESRRKIRAAQNLALARTLLS